MSFWYSTIREFFIWEIFIIIQSVVTMRSINSALDVSLVNNLTVNCNYISFYFHSISSHTNYTFNKISAFRWHVEYNNLTPLR
ncbi:hypothetical protein D3C75_980600 [compost metagenome]